MNYCPCFQCPNESECVLRRIYGECDDLGCRKYSCKNCMKNETCPMEKNTNKGGNKNKR